MQRWSRRLTTGALVLLIAAALAYGFRPQPVEVEVARAVRAPLQVTVEEEGRTRVRDRFVISAPVAGYAHRIDLDVGDAVRRGETLLVLDPLPSAVLDARTRAAAQARVAAAQASVRAARENVAAAQATADYARAERERLQRLRAAGHASAEDVDRAAAEAQRSAAALRAARLGIEVAEHEREEAQTALTHSDASDAAPAPEQVAIHAPVEGRVLALHHESAGPVESGQSLLEIGDPRALEVEVELLSEDAVRVRPGARVLFERWGGDAPLEGVVRRVEPAGFTKISALGVEEQRTLVISDFTSPPERWSRLGDGYRVEASFILWEGEDVLQIPASALFREGGSWAVFVADGGRARLRRVNVGHTNGLRAQVRDGLAEGDAVIVHPDESIEDGTRLQIRTVR